MSEGRYLELRRKATVVPDEGGYCLEQAEMNPEIVRMAVAKVLSEGLPRKMWEPFACPSHKYDGLTSEIESVSSGLRSGCDVIADSTKESPDKDFGCVVFHPPYFGSAPQSYVDGDLSLIEDWDDYTDSVRSAMKNVNSVLAPNGFVVAVGRDYRAAAIRVRLDRLYIEAMDGLLELEEVWKSEPDIVLIARKMI